MLMCWWGRLAERHVEAAEAVDGGAAETAGAQKQACIDEYELVENEGGSRIGHTNQTKSGGASVIGLTDLDAGADTCKICDEEAAGSCQAGL